MKVAFIGGGNMGEAMLAAIIKQGIAKVSDIIVSDVKEERLEHLEKNYGVAVTSDNLKAVAWGEVIILAIKPQNLHQVMSELEGRIDSGKLILSIIAGARVDSLRQGLKHRRIVRVMPNTPSQIGEGVSVWTATQDVAPEQRRQAQLILSAMGREIFVSDESYLDMATAVSGSGPAYLFLFAEALISAAVEIGLPPGMAKELVLTTIVGSAHFAQVSGKDLAELRKMVTSPGGTTAEALSRLDKGGFSALVAEAVKAAYRKAKELGK